MSTFSAQPVVIDGKGHLLGRLASIISKQVSQICKAGMCFVRKRDKEKGLRIWTVGHEPGRGGTTGSYGEPTCGSGLFRTSISPVDYGNQEEGNPRNTSLDACDF